MNVLKRINKITEKIISDLKTLTIEMWPDYDNHISDWSVLYGVLEVPCLQEVAFTRCGVNETVQAIEFHTATSRS